MTHISFEKPDIDMSKKNTPSTSNHKFALSGDLKLCNAEKVIEKINLIKGLISQSNDNSQSYQIDLNACTQMDIGSAKLLIQFIDEMAKQNINIALSSENPKFLKLLHIAKTQTVNAKENSTPPKKKKNNYIHQFIENFGIYIIKIVSNSHNMFVLFGVSLIGSLKLTSFILVRMLTLGLWPKSRDNRIARVSSLMHHIEQAGVGAMPIIALMSFLVGGIIAQQGIFQLQKFGGSIYAINLVSILVFRELGVLMTAIMVAGRSGSAITAEIGAMRMREEVDALKIMGADPYLVLALPRILALVISLPLLVIVANLFGLGGGMVVAWIYGGFTPEYFIALLPKSIDFSTIFSGMFKAPFMALIIGIVACNEGFKVRFTTQSLGQHVTKSVVKGIFLVIVLDGIAAMFYAAIGY